MLLLRHVISSRGSNTPKVERLFSSIAQYLIYNCTNGRSKTAMYVKLTLNIIRRTGNKAVITWLNRYGHCISYTDVGWYQVCWWPSSVMFEQWLCFKCHAAILASYICVVQWGPQPRVSIWSIIALHEWHYDTDPGR